MALGVDGQYFSDVIIGGTNVPFSAANSNMCIIENVRQLLPTYILQFNDSSGVFTSSAAIGDGLPIQVKMGQSKDDMNKDFCTFTSYGAPKTMKGPTGTITRIMAHLNSPNYLNTIPKKPFIGNSSDVMNTISDDCNFSDSDIDDTNDTQTWLTQNKKYGAFAEKVTEHAWVDENSCMVLGVDSRGKLFFKNVNELTTEDPVAEIYIGTPSNKYIIPAYPAYDYSFSSYAGMFNVNKGYNAKAVNWNLQGANNQIDQVNIRKIAQNIEMSSDIKNYAGTGYSKMLPFDTGNTHSNYIIAQHQNERNLSQWSEVIYVISNMVIPIYLFDVVQFSIVNDQGEYNSARSGKYIVAAKTQHIDRGVYVQKHVLVSQGRNSSVTVPQI